MRAKILLLLFLLAFGTGAAHATGTVSPQTSCTGLTGLSIGNTTILTATEVGGNFLLPAHCNVVGVIAKRLSQQDPDHYVYGIGFAINLPDGWTGRFEMQGGSGSDGSLNQNPTGNGGSELASGWVVADDDGGHEDAPVTAPFTWQDDDNLTGGTAHFGIDAQARSDYGYNAMEQATLVTKAIIQAYYGHAPQRSYFWGCSNGGRDAMMQAEEYPDNYDGVVAANPGFDLPRAAIAGAWNEQALARLATGTDSNGQPNIVNSFTNKDLEVASAAILEACDALDGLTDGIVDNYTACTTAVVTPHLANFTCGSGQHGFIPHFGTCLTQPQVAALLKIYAGPTNSAGQPLYSNWFWDAGIWTPLPAFGLGFAAWNVSPGLGLAPMNLTLGAGSLSMLFHNPPAVTPASGSAGQEAFVFNYNFDTDAPTIFQSALGYPQSPMQYMAANSTNLAPFAQHGGKLIIYDAVNDGIFSGADLINWYTAMNKAQSGSAQSFARLFMIPNIAHCFGGPGTNDLAASTLTALVNWVEQGQAPQRLIATNHNLFSPFTSFGADPFNLFAPGVTFNFPAHGTRPICPYPQQTRYSGTGATNDASNFVCATP